MLGEKGESSRIGRARREARKSVVAVDWSEKVGCMAVE